MAENFTVMKIVFICSCIEPGKDGIGDYARELAVALIRQGHETRLLGLAERFCSAEGESTQESSGVSVPVLRLPEGLPWPERVARARVWLDTFSPDWVSVQFVIYGYSRKGLPWRLAHWLGSVCDGWRVHLMLHETWIGLSRVSPLKDRLIGAVQRRIIQNLVWRVRPEVVHTSIPLYRIMLSRAGINSRLLSIPSSISVVPEAKAQFAAELTAMGITPKNRQSWRVLGIFGTLFPGHDYTAFVGRQLALTAESGQRLALLTVGRTGAASQAILDGIRHKFSGEVLLHQFGERPVAQISGFLQNLDFGVAVAPSLYLGRSSAVAAMGLHGIKVLVPHVLLFPDYAAELAMEPEAATLGRPCDSFAPAAVARSLLEDLRGR